MQMCVHFGLNTLRLFGVRLQGSGRPCVGKRTPPARHVRLHRGADVRRPAFSGVCCRPKPDAQRRGAWAKNRATRPGASPSARFSATLGRFGLGPKRRLFRRVPAAGWACVQYATWRLNCARRGHSPSAQRAVQGPHCHRRPRGPFAERTTCGFTGRTATAGPAGATERATRPGPAPIPAPDSAGPGRRSARSGRPPGHTERWHSWPGR